MFPKRIVVLGAGMVGRAMAIDLSRDYQVLSIDQNPEMLKILAGYAAIETRQADLRQAAAVKDMITSADIVVGAVPGFLGYQTLKSVIETGKNIVDISFFPEDPFGLDTLAREMNVTAVVDAGVAPGMSNIILGYHSNRMQVSEFRCYVGGLPRERNWPFEYKAPFSPIDVLEEYTRPARLVTAGRVVEYPALSEVEQLDIPGVGTLEAFNTDGLRTLITTQSIPEMREKTLRYPGHAERMRMLRESGFFSREPLQIRDVTLRPIDLTAHLLFSQWKLKPGAAEFTVMQVSVIGREHDHPVRYVYNLLDEYDPETQTSSMARTTGYTCTGIVHQILNGQYTHTGISPPEFIGAAQGCFDTLIDHLGARRVHYHVKRFDL